MLNFDFYHYEALESTNITLRALAEQGAGVGTVVQADVQTAGRGSRGRHWVSSAGNLYCSVLLKPQCPIADAAQISFVMALAVGRFLKDYLPDHRSLQHKWPNDVLVEGKKISGILLEAETNKQGKLEVLIVGMGINLQHHPKETLYAATNLNEQANGITLGPRRAVVTLMKSVAHFYDIWVSEGFEAIRMLWLQGAANLGKTIEITLPTGKQTGIFEQIDSNGCLLLTGENGEKHRINSGDVFFPA